MSNASLLSLSLMWRAIIWAAFLQSTGARVQILGGTQTRSRLCCWYIKRALFYAMHARTDSWVCRWGKTACADDYLINNIAFDHFAFLFIGRGRAPFVGRISVRVCGTIWWKREQEGERSLGRFGAVLCCRCGEADLGLQQTIYLIECKLRLRSNPHESYICV